MIYKVEKDKIAIVGTGLVSYFITQVFQNKETGHFSFDIGVMERLPMPLGVSQKRSGSGCSEHKKVARVLINHLKTKF